ncbi:MAG TPA: ferrous iron transport protein A, partial [Epsilonproteobacteria bacterium]|nr:ferrous iron transport protein A [Campylobacterota bacterium]
MLANQLKKGESATIGKINAEKALMDRLNSFGIVKGEEITIKAHSLAKQTIEIEVNGTLIVLRVNEAEKIEIETE